MSLLGKNPLKELEKRQMERHFAENAEEIANDFETNFRQEIANSMARWGCDFTTGQFSIEPIENLLIELIRSRAKMNFNFACITIYIEPHSGVELDRQASLVNTLLYANESVMQMKRFCEREAIALSLTTNVKIDPNVLIAIRVHFSW
jgi:hypothetical protein